MKRVVFVVSLLLLCVGCFGPSRFSISEHEDLRGIILKQKHVDLTTYDLREHNLFKTKFDSFTEWPENTMMPRNFHPDDVMQWGMSPGLHVATLHQQGITGMGVHVAIIDQPLLLGHIEYAQQIAQYTEIHTEGAGPQMHGAAVASLLAGINCGVAPKATVHYWAEPSWKRDYQYRNESLSQILAYNQGKPPHEQIRVVSVSKGFDEREPYLEEWKELLQQAKEANVYVIHTSRNMFGVGSPVYQDKNDWHNYEVCAFASSRTFNRPGYLFAPTDNRTYASWQDTDAYIFSSQGGLSWAAPYIAGVVALGLQVHPNLSESDIEKYLYETGYEFQHGRLVNPVKFVETVKALTINK